MTNNELKQVAVGLVGEDELARRFRLWITNLIRTAKMKKENLDPDASFEADVKLILEDLNTRTKARYTPTDKAKHLIRGRMKEGYLLQDFLRVNEVKTAKWLSDPTMKDYLRPTTLYIADHFDEYLAEWYAMDRQKHDLAEKRQQAQARTEAPAKQSQTNEMNNLANAALISELNARPWHAHQTFAALVKWTYRFPDADSLGSYPMPDRIKRMRLAPRMLMEVTMGRSPQWAEDEFAKIKEDFHAAQ